MYMKIEKRKKEKESLRSRWALLVKVKCTVCDVEPSGSGKRTPQSRD